MELAAAEHHLGHLRLLPRLHAKSVACDDLFDAPEGAAAVKRHAFFSKMDWGALMRKEIPAPVALSDVYNHLDGNQTGRGRWTGSG